MLPRRPPPHTHSPGYDYIKWIDLLTVTYSNTDHHPMTLTLHIISTYLRWPCEECEHEKDDVQLDRTTRGRRRGHGWERRRTTGQDDARTTSWTRLIAGKQWTQRRTVHSRANNPQCSQTSNFWVLLKARQGKASRSEGDDREKMSWEKHVQVAMQSHLCIPHRA